MAGFSLKLGDYAALVGALVLVVGAGVGSNSLVSASQVDAAEARLAATIALTAQQASAERANLAAQFSQFSNDITEIVEQGVEKRTDQLLAAMSNLTQASDIVTVRVANFPSEGRFIEAFGEVASSYGTSAVIYNLGNTGIASMSISDFSSETAAALQALIEQTPQIERDMLTMQFELGTETLWSSEAMQVRMLEAELQEIESRIERLIRPQE